MAKAKKQETDKAGGKAPKAAPKPAPKAKASGKSGGRAAAGTHGGQSLGVPLIDTSLAAEAAAKMVLHRASGTGTGGPPAPQSQPPQSQSPQGQPEPDKRETSTFKQLKQGLNKTGSQNLGGVLGGVQSGKKSNQPFGGGNQHVRNQTFGADVNRSGVPRRTGG
jgi:hypothetical protein